MLPAFTKMTIILQSPKTCKVRVDLLNILYDKRLTVIKRAVYDSTGQGHKNAHAQYVEILFPRWEL